MRERRQHTGFYYLLFISIYLQGKETDQIHYYFCSVLYHPNKGKAPTNLF